MAPHLSRLSQTVQIRGHCTCFCADLIRLTPSAHSHLEPCNLFFECFNSVHVCFQACFEVFIGKFLFILNLYLVHVDSGLY